jgi:hypothetical protein
MARFDVCGLNAETYNQRMRAEKIDELGRPLVHAENSARQSPRSGPE